MALKVIGDSVKEDAIYFRYAGESRPIKPGKLRQIIAEHERKAVADFSRRMRQVAKGSIATLDPETGEVTGKSGTFVIDRTLLPEIQFIREGEFNEIKGAPALKIVGEVTPIDANERERVRTIRDAVTPNSIINNFLRQEKEADPMQYIHAQAHYQQRWMPVWFYVEQTGLSLDDVMADMQQQISSRPGSRTALLARLKRDEEAYKIHPGKPIALCKQLEDGGTFELTSAKDISCFASALQGLKEIVPNLNFLCETLLSCLDKSMGETPRMEQDAA